MLPKTEKGEEREITDKGALSCSGDCGTSLPDPLVHPFCLHVCRAPDNGSGQTHPPKDLEVGVNLDSVKFSYSQAKYS